MSVTTTTHYGLKKPDIDEAVLPDPFNDNADVIDEKMFAQSRDTGVSLSDDVAAALGLSGNPQVKDALDLLSSAVRTNRFWWEKYSVEYRAIQDTPINTVLPAGSLTIYNTLNVDPTTGAITVSGASTIIVPSSSASTPPTCINFYYIDGGIYYKFTSSMTWTSVYSDGYFTAYRAKITASKMPITHLDDVFSNVQTTYPVNAIQGSYWYIYKGSDPIYNSHYVKLLEVTTTADAQQINLDLSGIDLTKYAKLELLGNISLGSYTITSPMNLQVLVPEGGSIRWRPANSSTEYGDRSYVAQYPLSYGSRGTIRLDIMLPINIIDDSYGNYVLFNGSGFCGAYSDKLSLDYGGARYRSLSDFKTLAFLSTRTDGKIKAGANFVIYGVKR